MILEKYGRVTDKIMEGSIGLISVRLLTIERVNFYAQSVGVRE